MLFSLDDHQAPDTGPGSEGGAIDGDGNVPPLPDGQKPDVGVDSGGKDSASDAPAGECPGNGPRFTDTRLIPGLDYSSANQHSVRGTNDGRIVYLTSDRPAVGVDAGSHVFVASRATISSDFGTPTTPSGTNVNSSNFQRHAMVTNDDQTMFYVQLTGANLVGEIWRAHRDTPSSSFGTQGIVQGLPTADYSDVYINPDGTHLYAAKKNGTSDIYHSTGSGTFSTPVLVDGVNTGDDEYAPVVSTDLKTMYFARSVGGQSRVYVATGSNGAAFANVKAVCGLEAGSENTYPSWISPDGKTLFYVKFTGATGRRTLWQATGP